MIFPPYIGINIPNISQYYTYYTPWFPYISYVVPSGELT